MKIKEVRAEKGVKSIGPYSQAISAGDFIFTSGQLPINPLTNKIESNNIEEQAKQVFENLKIVLEEANSDLNHIVKATCYLKDLNDFTTLNKVYASYVNDKCFPSRSAFQVARLPLDALVEIEVIAVKQ